MSGPRDGEARDVARFSAGREEEAFRRLYRRCTPRMHGLATRMLGAGPAVADAVQEAWVRIVRDLDRFEGRSRFDTWALGYVVHCCREEWRRRGVDEQRSLPLDSLPTERSTVGTSRLPVAADPLDLEAALGSLAPGYRSVLLLHDLYGMTHAEIAEALGIAEGTAKSQLARARAALRERLADAGPRAVPSNAKAEGGP